ncbi:hypothetical protein Xbed_00163 [Xenorhabdus beddingii]|uniref:Uncharacterized protein n=1 Tax=Xenorhabdus beddingii TaxID=40578 RepID=A0A1Y2SSQ0_9GAMM|nr:hypothetical protein Xbed_00163 [Xenorhabdus beddingii]
MGKRRYDVFYVWPENIMYGCEISYAQQRVDSAPENTLTLFDLLFNGVCRVGT